MFKLLIVDDESYTRNGIIDMISWEELKISEIRQAFDGVNALEIIKDFNPDIVLTDIKMPRMNGIDLAINIRNSSPHCEIIFMSSYSDKIYLKSAIQLKAVNYIEKPLDLEELYNSIKNATSDILKTKDIQEDIESKIALDLLKTSYTVNAINNIINNYSKEFVDGLNNKYFVNVVINLINEITENKSIILNKIKNLANNYKFNSFIGFKNNNSLILNLFSSDLTFDYNSNNNLELLLLSISEYINNFTNHYISVGTIENSIDNLYLSYNNSKIALNNSFSFKYNSIIFSTNFINTNLENKQINYKDFEILLKTGDKNAIFNYTQKLVKVFKVYGKYSFSFIKDVYYNLVIITLNYYKSKNIDIYNIHKSEDLLSTILSFNNIYELNDFLWEKLNIIFNSDLNKNKASEPIEKIIEFIDNNYTDPNFSLDEVSKNTYLSPSYICVIFKDFMGMTLNKYVNELRINKAKELLKDNNIKLKEIATKTGFNDGNYFTKIFKKETGYNPSDYRRNFIK